MVHVLKYHVNSTSVLITICKNKSECKRWSYQPQMSLNNIIEGFSSETSNKVNGNPQEQLYFIHKSKLYKFTWCPLLIFLRTWIEFKKFRCKILKTINTKIYYEELMMHNKENKAKNIRLPVDVTISFNLITFSWWSFFNIFISLIAVIGNCRRRQRLINNHY